MKNKLKFISLILAVVLLLGKATSSEAQAFWPFDIFKSNSEAEQTQGRFPALIQRIIDKFSLNEAEVEEVVTEYRNGGKEAMQNRFEENLQKAVEEGKLTETQKSAIQAKHEEMQKKREGWANLSPEERLRNAEEHREEMRTWAEENGIDLEQAGLFGIGFGRGSRTGPCMENN